MVVVMIILFIVVISILVTVYEKITNATCKSIKRLEDKVAVVTGGTAGMGLEIAKDFAHRGAKVIIACPFVEEGEAARKIITEATGNEKIVFKFLNLASISSVKTFVAEILEEQNRLDILVNNAGVGIPYNSKTYNGSNFIMNVNYIGHFLLTILLLPLLKKTGTKLEPSRIINTASFLHLLGTLDFTSKNRNDFIYRLLCYSNSKYCCILFGHVLSKRLKGSHVVVNAVDPGIVGTGIFGNVWLGRCTTFFSKNMLKNPQEGAQTALHAALDERAGQVTGQLFKNCELSRAKGSAYDDDLGNKLFEQSIKLVKLENEELFKYLN